MGKAKNKDSKKSFNFGKINGFIIVMCMIAFLSTFVYEFIKADSVDSNSRWCANCQTYHNINEEREDEVWCNNCNAWHAPRDESNNNKSIQ